MAGITYLGATFTTTAGNKTFVATPAVGDLIVIITACTGLAPGATNVVDNNSSGTYTQVGTARTGFSTTGLLQVWIRDSFITSAVSTTFTAQQASSTGGGLSVFKVTGMFRTGGNAALQTAGQSTGTAGTTPAPAFAAAVNTNNPVIGGVGNGTSPATLTPRTGFTEGTDLGYATPTAGLETMFRASGETGTTMTWGSTSATAFASVAVELDTTALPGPQVVVTEGAWADSTSPHDIVVTGCLTGDWLVRISGGDGGLASGNAVTASAFSTTAGSTGAWSDVEKRLPTGGTGWIHIGAAQVTADGDVTVRATRTQTGTARAWGGAILRCRNSGGIGVHGFVNTSATQVVSLAGLSQDSVVGFILVDWDAGTPATGYTPAGAFDIERANESSNYTVACSYWSSQASGTRNYGAVGISGTNLVSAAVEILAASTGPTAVGKDLGLVWNTRVAIGDPLQLVWNTRVSINKDVQLLWNTRQAVGKSVQALWTTKAPAGKDLSLVWNDRATFGKTLQAIWNVRTFTGKDLQLLWNTRQAAGKSVSLLWNDRAAVSKDIQFVWDTQSGTVVGKSLSLLWNTRAPVGDDLQLAWNTRTVVGDPLDLRWNTRAAIGDNLSLAWNVRAAVGDPLQLVWNTRVPVGDPLQLVWNTRQAIGDQAQLLWNTRQAVGKSVSLVWDVQIIGATAVGKSLGLVWNTRAAIGDDLALRWNTRALVADEISLRWNVRSIAGDSIDLRWGIRTTVGKSGTYLWDVRTVAGKDLILLWSIETAPFIPILDPVAVVVPNPAGGSIIPNSASISAPNGADARPRPNTAEAKPI
jgi:hypothetical protein